MMLLYSDYYLWSFGGNRFPESGKASARDDATSRSLSLEEEIRILRNRMEQLFLQEKSFTSDNVVEISSKLDLKINEYMKRRSRKN
ncbi:aspartyl-phosphate phosphatase Spo0E family protein [Paenibacillus sp. 7124]|uniref:Aspartyl-phosphate phosphatase Spo0E family protein n=1 Tax=Paenibacillus apii TaxID=1850370 RepID=A0A6M1PIH6_9BACL|nr:aspartyl-phosphate phosphatase Spo0E family protein [Paenibacillus apii]NGM82976.1 aspartyl-phosphate phosphatase Spo0E family protein [Paenibacillus apii]NJJ40115.1 aspartyl-phosphate phosphatase Spo0E family protein [Paenibacillus apii]